MPRPRRARRAASRSALCSDIDAPRRLVEQQHIDVVMEQPRERHFLLIAARQLATGCRGPRHLIASRSIHVRAACVLAARDDERARVRDLRAATASGCPTTVSPTASPSPLRSSLSMPIPFAQRLRGAGRPVHAARRHASVLGRARGRTAIAATGCVRRQAAPRCRRSRRDAA